MVSVNPPNKTSKNQIKINGLNINYKTIGNGDIPIVLLHGWGVNSDKYLKLARCLSELQITNYELRIFIPDLPGFGKSEEPKESWNLDNYVKFVDEFIKKTNRKSGFELVKNILEKKIEHFKQYGNMYYHIVDENQKKILKQVQDDKKVKNDKAIILIGHSFGGRIAIKYAVKYPEKIEKLILTGAAGIKHKPNLKQRVFFVVAKAGKKFFSALEKIKLPMKANKRLFAFIGSWASKSRKFLYKAAREKDYYQASPRMKEIMKNVLAEDLMPVLKKIKTPTLLVWGADDKTTPLADGKIMNSKIANSELKIIGDANHSLPYQKPEEFAGIVAEFLRK